MEGPGGFFGYRTTAGESGTQGAFVLSAGILKPG